MNISKYLAFSPVSLINSKSINSDRRKFVLGLASLPFVANCGSSKNELEGLVSGEIGVVANVQDGDALYLDSGLTVRLAGIEAPRKGWKERKADLFGEEAANMLAVASVGRKCQLFYGGLTRDRYNRAIAHVYVEDEVGRKVWLNGAMIKQGGARVRTWADNSVRVRELYALEQQARGENLGLWQFDDYGVLIPSNMQKVSFGLVIVEGIISELKETLNVESRCEATLDGKLEVSLGLGLARSKERLPLQVGQKIRIRSGARREKNEEGKYSGKAILMPDHWGQFETILT